MILFCNFSKKKSKSFCRPARTRKEGLELSENTVRKLSALLWNNGNVTCSATDCGVKTDEANSSNELQQKNPIKDEDNENMYNNNDLKHCIVEINGNYQEKNNDLNDKERQNKDTIPNKSESKLTDVQVEILHQGTY